MHNKLNSAVKALQNGNIIAYPTEGIYGIGCDPMQNDAIENLLKIKNRSREKGFILVAANILQLKNYVNLQSLNTNIKEKILASWPGATTWILPAKDSVPRLITGNRNTIAVRVSNHSVIQKLCNSFKQPIISTSANPSNLEPALNYQQCINYFGDSVSVYLQGSITRLNQPTTIFNAVTEKQVR